MIKADTNNFSFLFFLVIGGGIFVLKIRAKAVQIIIFFNVYKFCMKLQHGFFFNFYKKVFTILHEVTAWVFFFNFYKKGFYIFILFLFL